MIKTETFEEVIAKISGMESPEERIRASIDFMREAISSEGKPRFRDFWRMKKSCFDLFASETNPIKRTFFWKEYSELLGEAHRLQEMFKEETLFQAEQIKLAMSALANEIENLDKAKAISLPLFDRFFELKELEQRARFFESLKEKVILLRQEVLALEIRVHQKNELLEELKGMGDRVFPEYKQVVQELTLAFEERANRFFEKFSKVGDKSDFKRDLRRFQAVLKEIHIGRDSYRKFRERFSDAWKELESSEEENASERAEVLKQQEEEEKKKAVITDQINETMEELKKLSSKKARSSLEKLKEVYHQVDAFEEKKIGKRQALLFSHYKLSVRERILEKMDVREEERRLFVQDTKLFLERLRKELISCGLDIEFAATLSSLIEENKQRLL